VASKRISAGYKITAGDLAIKRPGFGIAPKFFEQIIGGVLNRTVEEDEIISWSDLR
jgi:N-acetylneuraminate synthase